MTVTFRTSAHTTTTTATATCRWDSNPPHNKSITWWDQPLSRKKMPRSSPCLPWSAPPSPPSPCASTSSLRSASSFASSTTSTSDTDASLLSLEDFSDRLILDSAEKYTKHQRQRLRSLVTIGLTLGLFGVILHLLQHQIIFYRGNSTIHY